MQNNAIYIQLFSIHGLLRSTNLELGRDADTGGQINYVVELAKELGSRKDVCKVDLITRRICDKRYSKDYCETIEPISEKVRIVRIQCGGGKYIRKEMLWPHLYEFIDKTLIFIKKEGQIPDIVHGHYADSGRVAMELANFLGVPFVFTGHSLGRNKKLNLLENGLSEDEINRKFRINHRIQTEEDILRYANIIIASTKQEVEKQYGLYKSCKAGNYCIVPPGIDTDRFYPFYKNITSGSTKDEKENQANFFMLQELERFLMEPNKPLILALSRPERKKNISGLITAFGMDKELQAIANLAVFAGIRKDISMMDDAEKEVLTELLLLMDKYDLYGKLAIPKKHDFENEVPVLYRIAAKKRGVFVNPAFIEPFGLTLIEASASGLPIVSTDDGGPRDIVENCQNGILVNVHNSENIASAIKKILVNRELWKKYSKNGIQGVKKYYSWSSHCKKYLEQLNALPPGESKHLMASTAAKKVGKKLIELDKLLITDIDNTLLGDEESLEKLLAVLKKYRDRICFGVATGRTLEATLSVLKEHNVPAPDLLISAVGTEINYGVDLLYDKGWETHLSYRWNNAKIKELLSGLDFLEPQEDNVQRKFKISYYMKMSNKNLAKIHRILSENKVRYNLIYSSESYLDILPFRASKGKAIRYICYKWNIMLDDMLVAGDSGNDEEMLRGSMLGVVVANYSSDLEKLRSQRRIYFSPYCCAGGILDGLKHYKFLDD